MNAVLEEKTELQPIIGHFKNNGTPKAVRWTRNQYNRMAELGFFKGKRVELIKAEIIEMSPMKSTRATAVRLFVEVLRNIFAKGFVVDSQLPMSFSKTDEPEPDIAVVKGNVRDFTESHPKTAELLIEVSDSSLDFDRTKKGSLYAENNIKDYWILNLKGRCMEVYRRPVQDKQLGFIYTESCVVKENETISPLAMPKGKIKVSDVLP
jgi:Uncharacterized protein conserved in cyanobacteria